MDRRTNAGENAKNSLHWEKISKKLLIWMIVVFLFGCLFLGLMFGASGSDPHIMFKEAGPITFFCIFVICTLITIFLLIIKIKIHKYLKAEDYVQLGLIPSKVAKVIVGIGIVLALGALIGAICMFTMVEDPLDKYLFGILLIFLCGLNIFLSIYYGKKAKE